jgi:hypothetical protein
LHAGRNTEHGWNKVYFHISVLYQGSRPTGYKVAPPRFEP